MSSRKEVAKILGIKVRIGSYGLQFFPKGPSGRIYKLIQFVPLDGWTFDPHEIVEAFANDPDFSISYKDKDSTE